MNYLRKKGASYLLFVIALYLLQKGVVGLITGEIIFTGRGTEPKSTWHPPESYYGAFILIVISAGFFYLAINKYLKDKK